MASACTQQPPKEEKPSGLKNMAPPSIADQVFENLDKEPNDTMLQATDITLSGDELHFTGQLTSGDTDTWRIKAKSGTIVDIVVTPQNFDVITDFSPTDKESARRVYDEHASGEENLTNLRLTPQGGYLTIRGRNTENVEYNVSIVRILARGDEIIEQEPNEDLASAQPIWTDRELNATLNPSDDVDYFKLNQTKPSILTCDFGSSTVIFKVLQNNKAIYQIESIPGEPVRTPPLQSANALYARIESLTPTQEATRYRCRLTALDTIPNEIEPNDTPETAQKIADTADDVEFSFLSPNDIDVFRITTPTDKAHRYTARIEAPEDVSATLNILSVKGTPLVQPTGARACLFGTDHGQDMLLRIAHAPTNKTYPLNYRLHLSRFEADKTEAEPNNATTQSTAIMPGTPLQGFIFPENDIDFYRVDIPSTATATSGRLEVSTSSGYISRLNIRLQDAAGFEITRAESQQASRPIKLSFDAPAGTYYIAVSGEGDQCLKPYTLNVSYTPNEVLPAEASPGAQLPQNPDAPPSAAAALPTPSNGVPTVAPAPSQPAAPTPSDAPTPSTPTEEVNIDLLLQAAAGSTPQKDAKPTAVTQESPTTDKPAPQPAPTVLPEEDEDAF